ncbi:MAG TPA: ABC transporter permease [Polyangiaceae bacterium]|nr:ABC transporter permease [Polyangiaceae bacterium]
MSQDPLPAARSTLPYDPRIDYQPRSGFLGGVGRKAIHVQAELGSLFSTLGQAISAWFAPGRSARRTVHGVLLAQILFTGVQALALVSVIGILIGATTVVQTSLMVPGADAELLGKILVAVVLRELAPLITAIIVAGRSGTAIATELGNMKVNYEVLGLESLGIDPPRFIVLPRVLAAIVSVVVLMVYFGVVSVLSAALVGQEVLGTNPAELRTGLAQALLPHDIILFLAKGVGLGAVLGWFACHYGLRVRTSPTEVPRQASTAVVRSLLGCVLFDTALTVLFYWLSERPLH